MSATTSWSTCPWTSQPPCALLRLHLSHLLANVDPCSLWSLGNLEQLDLSHSLATVWGPLLPTLALAHWEPAAASWGCGPGHHARPGGPLAGNDISKLEAEAFAALCMLGLLSLVGNSTSNLR